MTDQPSVKVTVCVTNSKSEDWHQMYEQLFSLDWLKQNNPNWFPGLILFLNNIEATHDKP